MNVEQLRGALQSAEDAIAFFARAAIMRHCAGIARDAGSITEAARLMRLANEAEAIVATVVARVAGQLRGPGS